MGVHGTDQAILGLGRPVTNDPSGTTPAHADNDFAAIEVAEGGTLPAGSVGTAELAANAVTQAKLAAKQQLRVARSQVFNLDNGAGVTIDDVVLKFTNAILVTEAKIVYVGATTGTVAAGNAALGTTLGGGEIVAATAYGDTKAVGTETAMTIVSGVVAANGAVFCRHTGVAATQAGEAYIQISFTLTD